MAWKLSTHATVTVLLAVLLLSHALGAQSAGDAPFSIDELRVSVTVTFNTTQEVTLRGVVSGPLTPVNRADGPRYFKVEVPSATGTPTTWSVLLRKAGDGSLIIPGAPVTVIGWAARDGSHRVESGVEKVRATPR